MQHNNEFQPFKSNSQTIIEKTFINGIEIEKHINEFWTSQQRQANSIHEISYRACFKPQLPRFFIEKFTKPNDFIYDPFTGRGTTIIEAALLNRNIISNDINPLSRILCEPRLLLPDLNELSKRLSQIDVNRNLNSDISLDMFFHHNTLKELISIRQYLIEKGNKKDHLDKWIQMIATNRLTGHSKGFFSVYTLPPNQAISAARQIIINKKRNQKPEYRDTRAIILKKSKQLIKNISSNQIELLKKIHSQSTFICRDARKTPEIKDNSIQLTVTSPPFLDIVQYASDNWLRCWFNHIDAVEIGKIITQSKKIEDWESVMGSVLYELYRVTKKGGYVAFEVGEVRNNRIKLDEHIITQGIHSGFGVEKILINQQSFSKTANIWGVSNNSKGTNSNRIVILKK